MNTCYLQVLGALVRYQLKRSSTLSQAFLNCLVSCLFFVLLSGASGSFQVWVDEGFVFGVECLLHHVLSGSLVHSCACCTCPAKVLQGRPWREILPRCLCDCLGVSSSGALV